MTRSAILAWAPWRNDATHHLVLTDDALVLPGFSAGVAELIETVPDRPISLFCEWGSISSFTSRFCALAGMPWGPVMDTYVPDIGLIMPRNLAQRTSEMLKEASLTDATDEVIGDYLRMIQANPIVATPNLVEHDDQGSVMGNYKLGLRLSTAPSREPAPNGWWSRKGLTSGEPLVLFPWYAMSPFLLREAGATKVPIENAMPRSDKPSLDERFEMLLFAMKRIRARALLASDGKYASYRSELWNGSLTRAVRGVLRRELSDICQPNLERIAMERLSWGIAS